MAEYIFVRRLIVEEHGLPFWVVSTASIISALPVELRVIQDLDAHWQHRAAMQCAERWSRELNLPIWGKIYAK